MAENQERQMRRRRSSGNPKLPLNLEVGFQVNEGGTSQGTPTPSNSKTGFGKEGSSALLEFRKKQQSFDVQVIEIEECEEEDIAVESDGEGNEEGATGGDRPVTPMPVHDFAANVTHTETPLNMDFLKVTTLDQDGVTDVSDADTEEE